MNAKYQPTPELRELLSALREGDLTPGQTARLEAALVDKDALAYYVRYMHLNADLQLLVSHGSERSVLQQPGDSAETVYIGGRNVVVGETEISVACPWQPNSERSSASERSSPRRLIGTFARWRMAALVMFTLASVGLLTASQLGLVGQFGSSRPIDVAGVKPGDSPSKTGTPHGLDHYVAKITRKVDCIRQEERWAVASSAELRLEQTIAISKGLLELQYNTGARVILEGPTRFTISGENQGYLHYGSLSAEVPTGAEGFRVDAPKTRLVDLGTAFAMRVSELGDMEVHVFDGEVTVERIDARGRRRGELLSLVDDMAVRSQRSGFKMTKIPSRREQFTTSLTIVGESSTILELPVTHSLALWLAADKQIKKNTEGAISTWGDILVGENTTSENAWQLTDEQRRPQWVADGIGGQPAVYFNGMNSRLVTPPLTSADDQTIFLVFASHGPPTSQTPLPQRHHRAQLVHFKALPTLVLEEDFEQDFFQARVFFGYRQTHVRVDCGVVRTHRIERRKPTMCCYRYSYTTNHAELFLDGVSQGTATAPMSAATTSERYIGGHSPGTRWGFHGKIAELIFYNSALSAEDREQVERYLTQKYKLGDEGKSASSVLDTQSGSGGANFAYGDGSVHFLPEGIDHWVSAEEEEGEVSQGGLVHVGRGCIPSRQVESLPYLGLCVLCFI